MARELYNWDQVRAYSVVALYNVLNSKDKLTLKKFVDELNPLQTSYGKEGIIGLANNYIKKENSKFNLLFRKL